MKQNAAKISNDNLYRRYNKDTCNGKPVVLFGETYYQIENCDAIPPFL